MGLIPFLHTSIPSATLRVVTPTMRDSDCRRCGFQIVVDQKSRNHRNPTLKSIIMKHPPAQSFLVALKKTIPAVLLLGTLSLGLASTARAQMTITFLEDESGVQAVYSGSVPSGPR